MSTYIQSQALAKLTQNPQQAQAYYLIKKVIQGMWKSERFKDAQTYKREFIHLIKDSKKRHEIDLMMDIYRIELQANKIYYVGLNLKMIHQYDLSIECFRKSLIVYIYFILLSHFKMFCY